MPDPLPFASPFSPSCYLLPTAKRFRIRKANGDIDFAAVQLVAKTLPAARDVPLAARVRLGHAVDRILKSAVAFGAAGAGGALDTRFGVPVLVEVPAGGTRTGVGRDGTPWQCVLTGCGYGFLPDTIARDEEPIDVILGPNTGAPMAFVLTQNKPLAMAPSSDPGTIEPPPPVDEYKIGLGFLTAGDFESAYLENWPQDLYGGITPLPLEVLQGLLGFELGGEDGAVVKSLRAITSSDAGFFAVGTSGAVFGRVQKVGPAPAAPVDAVRAAFERYLDTAATRRRNGASGTPQPSGTAPPDGAPVAMGLADFAGGGVLLPGQGAPRVRRGKSFDALTSALVGAACKASACRKALDSATAYKGNTIPLAERPDLASHPATTAPLSWDYDDPMAVGGWLGAIEGEVDPSPWICFVAVDGKALLWTECAPDGGVLGKPVEFGRPDLVPSAPAAKSASGKVQIAVQMVPISKALTAATPVERRLIYGVVLEPEPFDGRGDGHDETYSAEVIAKAAHDWCAYFGQLDDRHGRFFTASDIVPVETYLAWEDFVMEGTMIKKGSWVLGARVVGDLLWGRVLRGELSAWSIEGYAERVQNVV